MYVVLSSGSSADSKWRLTELCFLPAQHDRARMPNSWSQAYTSQLLWRTNVSVDGLCHGPGRTLMQLSSFLQIRQRPSAQNRMSRSHLWETTLIDPVSAARRRLEPLQAQL